MTKINALSTTLKPVNTLKRENMASLAKIVFWATLRVQTKQSWDIVVTDMKALKKRSRESQKHCQNTNSY